MTIKPSTLANKISKLEKHLVKHPEDIQTKEYLSNLKSDKLQASTQAYLTNQATCLALVDVLQKKHIFSPEEFYESLKIILFKRFKYAICSVCNKRFNRCN